MSRRRKQPTITVRPGPLIANHIRNRAKRLDITICELVIRAVMRVTDENLRRA